MKRRDFIFNAARGFGSAWLAARLGGKRLALAGQSKPPGKFNAQDTVVLGMTGIRTSRLALGAADFNRDGQKFR